MSHHRGGVVHRLNSTVNLDSQFMGQDIVCCPVLDMGGGNYESCVSMVEDTVVAVQMTEIGRAHV